MIFIYSNVKSDHDSKSTKILNFFEAGDEGMNHSQGNLNFSSPCKGEFDLAVVQEVLKVSVTNDFYVFSPTTRALCKKLHCSDYADLLVA